MNQAEHVSIKDVFHSSPFRAWKGSHQPPLLVKVVSLVSIPDSHQVGHVQGVIRAGEVAVVVGVVSQREGL